MKEILIELFIYWYLETWANVLEVVGFLITSTTLIIAFRLKNRIEILKINYLLDKRITDHIKALKLSASKINSFLNDYNESRVLIKTELSICKTELEDIYPKLGGKDSSKIKSLRNHIRKRISKRFAEKEFKKPIYIVGILERFYPTSSQDIWNLYTEIHVVIRQMENIKLNNAKKLKQ